MLHDTLRLVDEPRLPIIGEAPALGVPTKASEKLGSIRVRAVATVQRLRRATEQLQPMAHLLGRLGVGLVFLSTGWGKVHNVAKVTAFFESLHIPAPELNAVLVGWSELLCGMALVLGVLSRVATLPLIASMVVAILTARRAELHGILDLVSFDEFTYLVLLVMIAILGPGSWSADALLSKRLIPALPTPADR